MKKTEETKRKISETMKKRIKRKRTKYRKSNKYTHTLSVIIDFLALVDKANKEVRHIKFTEFQQYVTSHMNHMNIDGDEKELKHNDHEQSTRQDRIMIYGFDE